LEKSESLNKVLNIFIRVNSGGTQSSYSNLLLSIATAQWKEKDVREEITTFVDEINSIGSGFNINKDFVLKSCLVLSDLKDIAFKVDNFNQGNMALIEGSWEKISNSIRSAFILLSSFGYSRETLTSNNAVIPIAYYLNKIENPDNFPISSKYEVDRQNIFTWLAIVLIKRSFSGQSDNILRTMRDIIKNNGLLFPLDLMIEKQRGTSKSLIFDDDDIINLTNYQYGQPYTFSVLVLLYPSLDYRNKFHQDHIHPKRLFSERRLKGNNITENDIGFFMDKYNYISNLQLLEGIPNQEKTGKYFSEWISEKYPRENDRKQYMERNYIPDVSLELKNFKEFIEKREELIINEL
jgi:hypothetical protein